MLWISDIYGGSEDNSPMSAQNFTEEGVVILILSSEPRIPLIRRTRKSPPVLWLPRFHQTRIRASLESGRRCFACIQCTSPRLFREGFASFTGFAPSPLIVFTKDIMSPARMSLPDFCKSCAALTCCGMVSLYPEISFPIITLNASSAIGICRFFRRA